MAKMRKAILWAAAVVLVGLWATAPQVRAQQLHLRWAARGRHALHRLLL
jgi:hypothetical protein